MSTSDMPIPQTANGAGLDADLLDLLAVDPSAAAIDRLDRRVEGALRGWRSAAGRGRRARVRRRAGVVALLAATFVIGGATGSLQGLYLFLAGPFDVPWHRGVEIGASQVIDGYRVTIDRAYGDATRLALAISVVDERERSGTTELAAMATIVTDEAGEYTSGGGAESRPDGSYAAASVVWKQPSILPMPAGPRWIHVVVPFIEVRDDTVPPPNADAVGWNPWHRHAGPWTFDFELAVDGGTAIMPDAVSDIDGVRVAVTRLIAAPSVVRVEFRIDGNLPPGSWSPVGEIRHDGRHLRFVYGDLTPSPDHTVAFLTDGGVNDPAGEWTVVIEELVGDDGTRLPGPWVLRFDGP